MSERVEEYKGLVEKVLAPEADGKKLPDAEADAAFNRLDEIWTAMSDDERHAIEAWRAERQS